MNKSHHPVIPSTQSLPELTIKGIILGLILTAIMGGANAYLGLKVGQTVTACIPAAVLSMAILRLFKKSNILENNMVQTMVSAGEVMAAAAIFTLPALVMMGFWKEFSFFETTLLTIIGGTLGVFFSIPLRRALIVEEKLPYPEGVATAEILKAGDHPQQGNVKYLIKGGAISAILQFLQGGLQILADGTAKWFYMGGTVMGSGFAFSSALLGAGYVVGISVAISLAVGHIFMYGLCIPIAGHLNGLPDSTTAAEAGAALRLQLRYIGVGAMISGGIAALISIIKPIKTAIVRSIKAMKETSGAKGETIRTEKDMSLVLVGVGILVLMIPFYIFLQETLSSFGLPLNTTRITSVAIVGTFSVVIVGFLAASIAGYMAGLVGTSCNPVSGLLIASSVLISFAVLGLLAGEQLEAEHMLKLAAAVILILSVVACIAAVAGDNLQDLKSGYVVGSTPWKQQVGLLIGVVASSVVIAPIMQILYEAYGMGEALPHAGMDPTKALAAPQATLVATVTKGVFGSDLPYHLMGIGFAFGIFIFLIDSYMKKHNKGRIPALGVALGMYLPAGTAVVLILGGILNYVVKRSKGNDHESKAGILFASGAIAGEALVGIVLAVPFALAQSTDVFRFVPQGMECFTTPLGFAAFLWLTWSLYKASLKH